MHIRFPTEAANADSMRGDAPAKPGSKKAPRFSGRGGGDTGAPRGNDTQKPADEGEVKPGKDINAPGFVRD